MKKTAIAPSNVAFIKYWGRVDEQLKIPTNNSISMNLSNLTTKTTVEFSDQYEEDDITINNEKNPKTVARVITHLDRIRHLANSKLHAKVVSLNNFPTATGLSSSASGFAALTVAGCVALGLQKSEKELSIIARIGSGSACRSIPNGFVEWHKGDSSTTSYAETIYPADWWNIVDLVVCISDSKKTIPTTDGQMYASTSPLFTDRLKNIENKIDSLKKAISNKDFEQFGTIVEQEALDLHTIMLTSTPQLDYLYPETRAVMEYVVSIRSGGTPAYFTVNTGHNVHVITTIEMMSKVKNKLIAEFPSCVIIENKPTSGAHTINSDLF